MITRLGGPQGRTGTFTVLYLSYCCKNQGCMLYTLFSAPVATLIITHFVFFQVRTLSTRLPPVYASSNKLEVWIRVTPWPMTWSNLNCLQLRLPVIFAKRHMINYKEKINSNDVLCSAGIQDRPYCLGRQDTVAAMCAALCVHCAGTTWPAAQASKTIQTLREPEHWRVCCN